MLHHVHTARIATASRTATLLHLPLHPNFDPSESRRSRYCIEMRRQGSDATARPTPLHLTMIAAPRSSLNGPHILRTCGAGARPGRHDDLISDGVV